MPTTSNFGWTTPADTDLVKDGAAAIRTLGNGIDTSLVDLKGGTTGQYLIKQSNTDLDFTWTTNTADIDGVTATSPLTGGGTSGTITVGIQDATTAQKGAVQLTDSISSTSTTTAATPNSVKTAYDLANGAIAKSLVDAKADLITATADNTPARLAVGNNGETLVADSSTSTGLRYNPPVGSLANPVINGGFDIWQRGTSSTTTGAYLADRWWNGNSSAATYSRQTTGDTTNLPNIQYCLRMQRNSGATSVDGLNALQSFETVNSIPFAGKAVTVSFYARKGANLSGNLEAYLESGTGTDQFYWTGYTGRVNVATSIITSSTLTTTWQRYVMTGTVPATATELAIQIFKGSSGTAGAADFIDITGVQLDVGTWTASTAPTFRRSGGTLAGELAACQRYYQVIGGTTNSFPLLGGYISNGEVLRVPMPFPVQMRTAPTITKNGTWNAVGIGQPAAVYINTQGFSIQATGTANGFYLHPDSTDDSFTISAEL